MTRECWVYPSDGGSPVRKEVTMRPWPLQESPFYPIYQILLAQSMEDIILVELVCVSIALGTMWFLWQI